MTEPTTKQIIKMAPDILKRIVAYYKLKKDPFESPDFKPCNLFSEPALEQHACNSRVMLPGNRQCSECRGNVDVPCAISCDVQTFCLATYAYRLGIGGEDFEKALHRNLYKRTPEQLYDEVTLVLSCGIDALPKSSGLAEFVQEVLSETAPEEVKEPVEEDVPEEKTSSEDPITLWKAGIQESISYPTMKKASKDGRIATTVESDGKEYVTQEELKKFCSTFKRRGKK
jgi:hypothetical protein